LVECGAKSKRKNCGAKPPDACNQVADCLCWTGMGPDSRVLITKARKIAQKYMLTYGEPIPANQLVREVASVMQVNLLIDTYVFCTCLLQAASVCRQAVLSSKSQASFWPRHQSSGGGILPPVHLVAAYCRPCVVRGMCPVEG